MNFFKNLLGPKPNTIYKSITEGNIDEVSSYLQNSPDLKEDFQFEGILQYAIDNCQNNYFDMIKLLVESGMDINSHLSKMQETALHRLCARATPKIEIIEYLLKKGADVNALNKSGKTPLFYSTLSFSTELLKLLAEYGANVNVRDKYGNTILHDDFTGLQEEHFEKFLQALLELGFNINAENATGAMPLDFCENKKFENILIKYGAKKSPA